MIFNVEISVVGACYNELIRRTGRPLSPMSAITE
jgi:hypothetical protein